VQLVVVQTFERASAQDEFRTQIEECDEQQQGG
jgi:hypothetical protein